MDKQRRTLILKHLSQRRQHNNFRQYLLPLLPLFGFLITSRRWYYLDYTGFQLLQQGVSGDILHVMIVQNKGGTVEINFKD